MRGMLILARPHVSLWDGPRLAWWLTHTCGVHGAVFPVDPEYAAHRPMIRRLLAGYGKWVGQHTMVPLDSESPFSLRWLLRDLRQGRTVVLFPQGTGLSEKDRPDRPGARWLIRRANPVVLEVSMGRTIAFARPEQHVFTHATGSTGL